jgi:hypothetical protein
MNNLEFPTIFLVLLRVKALVVDRGFITDDRAVKPTTAPTFNKAARAIPYLVLIVAILVS